MTSQSHDLPIPEPTSVYLLDAVGFGHVKINNIRYEKLQNEQRMCSLGILRLTKKL